MNRRYWVSIAALVLGATTAWADPAAPSPRANDTAPTSDKAQNAADDKIINAVTDLIRAGRSAEAIPILDTAIADADRYYATEKRQIFCARSLPETLMYAGMGANAKKDTVVLGPEWSMLIFLKGFALVDVGRGDEAKPLFDRAIALSPMNAQFLAEEGEWYKARKDWANAYQLFSSASVAADINPKDTDHAEKRRALRGMGYALSEQRRFDEAEKLFRECLKLDPKDAGALQELEYIREQRGKGRAST